MDIRHCSYACIVLAGALSFSSPASAHDPLVEAGDQAAHFSVGLASAYIMNRVFGLPDWMTWSTVMTGAYVREAAQSGAPRRNVRPDETCGRGCGLDMTFMALGAGTAAPVSYGPYMEARDDGLWLMWKKRF
jgi:hypothetical protein